MFESVLLDVGTVVAQSGIDVNIDVNPFDGLVGSAIGAFLTTLVVGALLVALAPDYTDRMKRAVIDDAVGSLVYGLICLVFVVLVTIVLVITIVGILVAIPFALLAYLVWALGAAIAYLAIGERLVGDESWEKPLLVGAAINGVLVLTGVGGIIAFGIGAAGFGAVLKDWLA